MGAECGVLVSRVFYGVSVDSFTLPFALVASDREVWQSVTLNKRGVLFGGFEGRGGGKAEGSILRRRRVQGSGKGSVGGRSHR